MSGASGSDTIISGAQFTLRWAQDARGRYPARDFFYELSNADQKKVMALFSRLAEMGKITNREHFKKLGSRAKGRGSDLFEFKKFKIRFLGIFTSGEFVVCHGLIKKSDNLKPTEIERAVRVLEDHEQQQGRADEPQRIRAHGNVVGRRLSSTSTGGTHRRGD